MTRGVRGVGVPPIGGAQSIAHHGHLSVIELPRVPDPMFDRLDLPDLPCQVGMEFRDRHVWLEEGEFLIVPRGVEHRPVADEEAQVMLFEPATTLNTGDVRNERTLAHLERL